MGRIGAITGGIGDIVYTIPVMRKLRIDTVYVKENFYDPGLGSMYTVTKPLLESQGFTVLPTSGAYPFDVFEPGLQFDINLDAWRIRPGRSTVHIIKNMMLHFRCFDPNFMAPWLHGIEPYKQARNLIMLTPRWRDNSPISWIRVMKEHELDTLNTVFIGHPSDYAYFKHITGFWDSEAYSYRCIDYEPTANLLDMARYIAGSEKVFCNQGVALTIAQGLGKEYWLERKPNKTNTLLYTKNEHLL